MSLANEYGLFDCNLLDRFLNLCEKDVTHIMNVKYSWNIFRKPKTINNILKDIYPSLVTNCQTDNVYSKGVELYVRVVTYTLYKIIKAIWNLDKGKVNWKLFTSSIV